MYRLFLLALCCIFGASQLRAATPAEDWNCQQDEKGEWLCVTEKEAPQSYPPDVSKVPPPTRKPAEGPPRRITELQPVPEETPPPAKQAARMEGWNCRAGEEDTWDCTLVGPNPQGQAKIMEAGEPGLIRASFDAREKQVFKNMLSRMESDPWSTCTFQLKTRPQPAIKGLRDTSPTDIFADYSEIYDEELATLQGNVEVSRADQRLSADVATYNTASQVLSAQGSVYYDDSDLAFYSDGAHVDMPGDQAHLRNSLFIVKSVPARGRAGDFHRDNRSVARYRDVAYTSCSPGNEDWVLHASQLKTNQDTGWGSAKHAWLEFKGIPFLYTPYISFPIDDRRKSGLLAPSLGINDETGGDVTLPYYWNIAPNFDATLKPRYMTRRGPLLGTEFRYLTQINQGKFDIEYMPDDSERKGARGQVSFQHFTRFAKNLVADIDLNYVSDKDYLDELGNTLSFSNTRQLRSHADLKYVHPWANFLARVENFQVIDKTIRDEETPYRRLPQVVLDLNPEFDSLPIPLRLGLENEYVFFHHDSLVRGQRMHTKPSISVPLQTNYAFFTPKASLDYTYYSLTNLDADRPGSISRAIPIFSVDSGMFLERNVMFADAPLVHTIEPRLFYLYVPDHDQDDVPLFDTSLFDFNFSQLFRENRFSGTDRVNDANQVTLALTSRLLDTRSGRERLSASIGEIFYFDDLDVNLPGEPVQTRTNSNIVGELNALLTETLAFKSAIQWDPDSSDVDRGQVGLHYRNEDNEILNLAYRFRRELIDQGDVSFRLPIVAGWHAVGRWLYSFQRDLTLESFLGIEKESCCWRLRLIGRRYVNRIDAATSTTGDSQTGIFLQLELKGLTSFGDNVERFLDRNLTGYRIPRY